MKLLIINFPNGDRYSVPAKTIARIRAEYYVGRDIDSGDILECDRKENIKEEIEYALGDNYELKDWVLNNMNWCDLENLVTKLENKKAEVDLNEMLSGSDICIVESKDKTK